MGPVPRRRLRSNAPEYSVNEEQCSDGYNTPDGPLGGVRVVDFTNIIMGSYAAHVLTGMGAGVIKIESANGGSFGKYLPNRNVGMTGGFLHLNRNKCSVVLEVGINHNAAVLSDQRSRW